MNFNRFTQNLLYAVVLFFLLISAWVSASADSFSNSMSQDHTSPYWLDCKGCPLTNDQLRRQLAAKGIELIQTGDKLEIILGSDRIFMPRSNNRLRYDETDAMTLVARFLKTRGNVPIHIYGHTDEVGSDRLKLQRTQEQADTIAAYLWENGIPLGNMTVTGLGDTHPVASNQTLDGSAANRRIEIFTE